MLSKKVILLNIDLNDSDSGKKDFAAHCYLPEALIKEYIKAGGKLYDLKDFDKNSGLRFDSLLIDLVEKYHDDIRRLEGTLDWHKGNIEFRPEKGNNYDFKRFRIDEVRAKERFAIIQPYDERGSIEKIVYFTDFKWLNLPE